jgi:SAM-dependent methyltransferase
MSYNKIQNCADKTEVANSHLYSGFRFVSLLPSIINARELEASLISNLDFLNSSSGNFISVGPGYGDELSFFVSKGATTKWRKICAIDISEDVKDEIETRFDLDLIKHKFSFYELDVRDMEEFFNKEAWSCIQCGFVLHDIEYQDKQQVIETLYNSLEHGGYLIIADMFLNNKVTSDFENIRKEKVSELYNGFLSEALAVYNKGLIDQQEYFALCGDGIVPGLRRTKTDAIEGIRDFFEEEHETLERLERAKFRNIISVQNPLNKFLKIILAQK